MNKLTIILNFTIKITHHDCRRFGSTYVDFSTVKKNRKIHKNFELSL